MNKIKSLILRTVSLCLNTFEYVASFARLSTSYPIKSLKDVLDLEQENLKYQAALDYFRVKLPQNLRKHREFFKKENRGFGEDAFHTLWYLIFTEYRPRKCLEIGVYRGQIVTLWALISRLLNFQADISGITPLTSLGDDEGGYNSEIDYAQDNEFNSTYFGIDNITLVREYSTSLAALEYIESEKWDLIYIDGSHDYEVVKQDSVSAIAALSIGGLLVLDDAGLEIGCSSDRGRFAGHPGPSTVARELIDRKLPSGSQVSFLGHVGHNLVFLKIS